METITVRVVQRDREQPNPVQIKVPSVIELGELKRHLRAIGLKGTLYIDGVCKDSSATTTELRLHRDTQVRLKQTAIPKAPTKYKVKVYYEKTEVIIECFPLTILKELKYFIQDCLDVSASDLSFTSVKRKGKEKINLNKEIAVDFCSRNKLVVTQNQDVPDNPRINPNKETDTQDIPDEPMIRDGLLWVSKEVSHWEDFAKRGLRLTDIDIEDIKCNNRDNEEKRFQAFRKWRQQKGDLATWRALISTCHEIRKDELAKRIAEICK